VAAGTATPQMRDALSPYFDHDFADLDAYAAYMNDPASVPPLDPPPIAQFVTRPLFQSNDGGLINAFNIEIATGWNNGTYMLTHTKEIAAKGTDNSGDQSNILYMITLFDKTFNFTTKGIDGGGTKIFSSSFEQMFTIIGISAASDASTTTKALEANTHVITGIEDLRNSISSVSMDEEGVNLLVFQKSYAAAARVMTTLDEALDILINRTGIVGR
jgi:flagellar hook-associated protein 1 FlgK